MKEIYMKDDIGVRFVNEYEHGPGMKQHLNLSDAAWHTIFEDMQDFSNGDRPNQSGFLNNVFYNFHQDAEASISARIVEKKEELQNTFSSKEFKKIDGTTKELFLSKLINIYEKELKDKAYSYPKGVTLKFNVNKDNFNVLLNSEEAIYYNSTAGNYIKAVLEEYAQKPMYERARIYFKETVNIIESAIAQKNKLKIALLEKINLKTGEKRSRTFYMSPYKIVTDKTRSFNYILGYSEEIKEGGTSDRSPACHRLSKIINIRQTSMSGFISEKSKETLDDMIKKKGAQYLAGDLVDITVKFTPKGLEHFNQWLYMRPHFYECIDADEMIYTFHCTEFQATSYFFKFGRDVEILSPDKLRGKFAHWYLTAYEKYNK